MKSRNPQLAHDPDAGTDQTHDSYLGEWDHVVAFSPPGHDELYGEVEHDGERQRPIDGVQRCGLAEPIVISAANNIVSGYRRFFAFTFIRTRQTIPVRRAPSETCTWSEQCTHSGLQRCLAARRKATAGREEGDVPSHLVRRTAEGER